MIEISGKVVGVGIKDFGKGKDAVAKEVLVATIKLDQVDGFSGTLTFVPGDEESSFDLRDVVKITIDQPQGKLGLGRRARTSSAAAGH